MKPCREVEIKIATEDMYALRKTSEKTFTGRVARTARAYLPAWLCSTIINCLHAE